ncbi:hypothetical protein diail_3958 [Diaporthe ilicicola]|nr:hypothetical protein diail_3958 [Diaporthe ilicicola]
MVRIDTYFSDDDRDDSDHHSRGSAADLGPLSESYGLEVVSSKDFVVSSTPVNQPDAASHDYLKKSRQLPRGQGGRMRSRSASRQMSAKRVEVTPATAIRHPKDSEETKKKRRSTEDESDSDPFLGAGRPMNCFPRIINAATKTADQPSTSPSPARLRNSQLGSSPGFLNLHDAHDEVLSLIDELKTKQRKQTKHEVDAALMMCQEDLKGRSKDKTVGTAEANILEREAARIGRARDEASKQAPEAEGTSSPGEDAVFEGSLRLALTRLIGDARAALEAGAQGKSQAGTSTSGATRRYTPYPGADYRLVATTHENRALREQIERLNTEQEQARKENMDLKRKLEELEAQQVSDYDDGQDEPMVAKLGPWGKGWNIDGRRGG